MNGDAVHAEREARGNRCERSRRPVAARQAVGDDPDLVASVDLPVGEVDDVTENAANGRAHRMQDSERLIRRRHDQYQIPPTTAVPAQFDRTRAMNRQQAASARDMGNLLRENAIPIKDFDG
jgi:hypothetical protein